MNVARQNGINVQRRKPKLTTIVEVARFTSLGKLKAKL
jgi:hypothetical protein